MGSYGIASRSPLKLDESGPWHAGPAVQLPFLPPSMNDNQVAVPGVRRSRGALLGGEVDVHQAEALVVALGPSNGVSFHSEARLSIVNPLVYQRNWRQRKSTAPRRRRPALLEEQHRGRRAGRRGHKGRGQRRCCRATDLRSHQVEQPLVGAVAGDSCQFVARRPIRTSRRVGEAQEVRAVPSSPPKPWPSAARALITTGPRPATGLRCARRRPPGRRRGGPARAGRACGSGRATRG